MSLLTNGNFFFPGPTEVRSEVLQAMTVPMVPHRGASFESIYARMQQSLQRIFGTTRPVYVSSSSATGLMEAGIRCAPAGRVLAIVNGAFSARFADCQGVRTRDGCDRRTMGRDGRFRRPRIDIAHRKICRGDRGAL